MDKYTDVDNKKLNQVLRIGSKVLKKLYIFIILISIYIFLLIISKLNIMNILITLLQILSPLFIGIVITWLLRPIITWLVSKKVNKIFSVSVIYLIIVFFIYILISTFIPIFINEINEFVKMIPILLDDLLEILNKLFSNINLNIIEKDIVNYVNDFAIETGKDIPITIVNTFSSITSFVLGLIMGFYLLITDNKYVTDIKNYLKKDTYDLLKEINIILRNYVKGILLSSLLIFILSSIIFYIVGIEGALLFGFICGITNIIPLIGPYIGALIPTLLGFTKSIGTGILTVVMIFIVQTIEGNIIHPLIMSKSIKVHPVTVIISLLVFGYFFGIIGMIISTPLVAILKLLYFYLLKKYDSYKRRLVR